MPRRSADNDHCPTGSHLPGWEPEPDGRTPTLYRGELDGATVRANSLIIASTIDSPESGAQEAAATSMGAGLEKTMASSSMPLSFKAR